MRFLKIKYLFITLTFLLISCDSQKSSWTVKIETSNINIEKAYLYSYDLERKKTLIDSTTVSNGVFQFSATNKDNHFESYFFNFEKNQKGGSFFIIKNGIELSINYSGGFNISFYGSDYSKDLNNYFISKQQEVDLIKEIIPIYQNKDLTKEQIQVEIVGLQKKMKTQESDKLKVLAAIKDPEVQGFLILEEILTQSVIEKETFQKYSSLLDDISLTTKYGEKVNTILSHFNAYQLERDGGFSEYIIIKKKYEELSKGDKESEYGVRVKKSIDKLEQLSFGKKPPSITAKTIDGDLFNLKDINSKLVLIDFWASWCGPCRMENPHYKSLNEKYKNLGLTIIGYSLDTDKNKWGKAIETDGIDWINISNLKKQNEDEILINYQISLIPSNVLIKDGIIVARNIFGPELDNYIYNNLN